MEEIEYVRVRGGDPLVRFRAEYAERWEERQIMNLNNFTFEQMEDSGDSIDAEGRAGKAVVQLESGDIALSGGVRINMESEDVTIETGSLEWQDKEKVLTGRNEANVIVQRSDGTNFTGTGFSADARNRTWAFSGEVKGLYVEKDEDEEDKNDGEEKEFIPIGVEWSREEGERAPFKQVPFEQISSEQNLGEQAPSEQAPSEQTPLEQNIPREQIPREPAPRESAPRESAPREHTPRESIQKTENSNTTLDEDFLYAGKG